MKTHLFSSLAIAAITTVAVTAGTAFAQDSTVAAPAEAPALSYGVAPIVELAQAKVSDDVIVRYVQNSGTIFALKAPEIVYMKQQGVSDTVLDAMLDQRERLTGSTEPGTSVPLATVPSAVNPDISTPVAVPPVVYVAPAPSPTVYVIPDTQTYRYNHEYGYPYSYGPTYNIHSASGYGYAYCYPAVSVVTIGTGYRSGYSHSHLRHY